MAEHKDLLEGYVEQFKTVEELMQFAHDLKQHVELKKEELRCNNQQKATQPSIPQEQSQNGATGHGMRFVPGRSSHSKPSTSQANNRKSASPERRFSCHKCKQKFSARYNRDRHIATCKPIRCEDCDTICRNKREFSFHRSLIHNRKEFTCRTCKALFPDKKQLYIHRGKMHAPTDALQPEPWVVPPWGEDQQLDEVYQANRPLILAPHNAGDVRIDFNFPTNDLSGGQEEISSQIGSITSEIDNTFKLNVSFGTINQNVETGEMRYFVPFLNSSFLSEPIPISNTNDIAKVKEEISPEALEEHIKKNRPSTKWKVLYIVNVVYYVTLLDWPFGKGKCPEYLKRCKSLITLETPLNNWHTEITDRLCAFRCLALHKGERSTMEERCLHYFHQWRDFLQNKSGKTLSADPILFRGLDFSQFPDFEECFGVNLQAYNLQPDGSVQVRYIGQCSHPTTMYVNMYEQHLCFITDFASYAKKYQCESCSRIFKRKADFTRHSRSCSAMTKYRFKGGVYNHQSTIFERLEDVGIQTTCKVFKYFACFDFEAILLKSEAKDTPKVEFVHDHKPISVAISSNIEGHREPECFINEDTEELLSSMFSKLSQIREQMMKSTHAHWKDQLDQLDRKINDIKTQLPDDTTDMSEDDDCATTRDIVEDDENEEDMTEDEAKQKGLEKMLNHLIKLKSDFLSYLSNLPVFGFNSSNYDIVLIKKHFFDYMSMNMDKESFVAKRNNSYLVVKNSKFTFLDISNYIAPGYSYANFLKAYEVPDQFMKAFFPYEYVDSVERLDETCLPPHEAFYSSLKNANILVAEYELMQSVWQEKDMETLRDFLRYYNSLDTHGFTMAIEKLQEYYFAKSIDLFKTSISVPGVARKMLYQSARNKGHFFCSIPPMHKDLHYIIKRNLVCGPSIVFNRKLVKGEQLPKPDGEIIEKILGLDCNSLYLSCIGQEMPVGFFIRRDANSHFKPDKMERYMICQIWLDWLMKQDPSRSIKHRCNYAREIKLGQYEVDGYEAATQTVVEVDGCYFHGCSCQIGKYPENEREKRAKRTSMRSAIIQSWGYNVESYRECDIRKEMKGNKKLREFAEDYYPTFYRSHKGEVTESQILQAVRNDELFGMVETDLRVPDEWPDHFSRDCSPFEYYSELAPLYCNVEVPFEKFGETMQKHCIDCGLSQKPRKLLVGGLKARRILLATPLLKWYLDHGLTANNVSLVLEFRRNACFSDFVHEVTETRLEGDRDPAKAVISSTAKLIGNSSYGGLIMSKEKHRDVFYVKTKSKAMVAANDQRYRQMSELGNEQYEVEFSKKCIVLDLPIHLGFFILNYAKLAMVRFFYDFMLEFVPNNRMALGGTDTDSYYLALAGDNLLEVARDDKKEELSATLHDCQGEPTWFPRICCDRHKFRDKRRPGLFKVEAEGNALISLSSKTYVLRQDDGVKFSSKGVSKRSVLDPYQIMLHVLETHHSVSATNRGFRAKENAVVTYTQQREGFQFLYVKREIQPDCVSTRPLDMVLSPWPDIHILSFDQYDGNPLSPTFPCLLTFQEQEFVSADQLFLWRKAQFHDEYQMMSSLLSSPTMTSEIRNMKVAHGWYHHRKNVMFEICQLKLETVPEVADVLIESGEKEIVYCDPKDPFWSCGYNKKMVELVEKKDYVGKNCLGKIWLELRGEINQILN